MDDAIRFLNALAARLPADQRLILCGFPGDPDKAEPGDWRPRPWRPGQDLPFGRSNNGYVTVSSFGKAPDGSFRRRQGTFADGRALMVDDVGSLGPDTTARVDIKTIKLKPSAIIETSPGNFQYWYFLATPETDAEKFDGLIRAFIAKKLLGKDPGMAGITRVGRLPEFANAKPKYGGWTVRLQELNGNRRFTVKDLLNAFQLDPPGPMRPITKVSFEGQDKRISAFFDYWHWLKNHGYLKRRSPDMSGWTELRCPWIGDHSQSADTGSAIRHPAPENAFYGSFRCHHAHCANKGWAELTEWIAKDAAEGVEASHKLHGKRLIAKWKKTK